MRPQLLALLLALPGVLAAEKWSVFRSEPFSVYTNGNKDEARNTLALLVQMQHTLSTQFGKELQPVWPVSVVLRKGESAPKEFRLSRYSYFGSPAQLTELLLRENTLPFDEDIERGTAVLYSTLEVEGPRVRVGAPPPPAQRDLAWARMHLLFTDERYSGKVRVLLSNLAKGIDPAAAWRNSMGMTEAALLPQVKEHLKQTQFATASLNGKPIDPRRFREEELNEKEIALLLADLAFTEAAYLDVVRRYPDLREAKDGLAIFTKDKSLIGEDSGARALFAGGTMEFLEKSAAKNPRWPPPHLAMAELETEKGRQAQRLRHAAQLAMRDITLWKKAAERFTEAELHAEATKCWIAAERAAPTKAQSAALREERLAADRRRVDAELAAQRAIEEKERQDLERLRQESLNRIRLAEAKANAGKEPLPPGQKIVEWWDGPKGDTTLAGQLERVDCVRGLLRLQVRGEDKELTPLLIKDVSKVALIGDSTIKLECGAQRPVRGVNVEYFAKTSEVTTVTFEKIR